MPRQKKTAVPSPVSSFSEELQSSGKLTKGEVIKRMAAGLYVAHPEQWPMDALGVKLDAWQKRAMRKLFLGEKHRLAVRAGHSSGKTFLAAVITHFFLMNFCPSRIAATGPTGRQTRSQYWALLQDLWNISVFKDDVEWQRTKMFVRGEQNEETWFATWLSSKNPKNMEGFHGPREVEGKNLLWVVEEGKGVSDGAYEGLSGALSSDDNYFYMSSTCGPQIGFFFRAFTSNRDLFETEHVPSTESSRVSEKQLEAWKKQYQGVDSPIYRARVLAEFTSSDDQCIVSIETLEAAVERDEEDDY